MIKLYNICSCCLQTHVMKWRHKPHVSFTGNSYKATNIHHHHDKHDGNNNEHDNDNNEKEEVGNDRDRGSRCLHVLSLRYYGMFIFFTLLNNLLIFFTDWLRTMTTVTTRMTATTATTGAWDATASWTPGKFFFFLFFLISLTNTYIYSGYQDATISSPFSTTVTPSKLQPTTQDDERGPNDGTSVLLFVP